MFVSGGQDKTVRFWDLRTGGCVNIISPGATQPNKVCQHKTPLERIQQARINPFELIRELFSRAIRCSTLPSVHHKGLVHV